MLAAEILVQIITVYLAVGGIVAAVFLAVGIERVDPSAVGAYAFRPLLVPGLCLIWPLVLWRWIALEQADKG